MTSPGDKTSENAAWAWIAVFFLLRLFYAGLLPLVPDEANYWQWGRHLALGYHDQAPMIGWLIRLSTAVFGETETAVRLPSVAAMTAASVYMVLTARRWYGPKAALATAVLSQSVFEFQLGGLLATPDGIQAAAWAGAAYHTARAYDDDRWGQWLAAGAWFGFGMLSKFTMVLFLPGAYLFGLLSKEHRPRLAGVKPYAGVLLGLAMFAPVIAWNAANDWNAVRHVAHLGGADRSFGLHFKYLGDYLGAQAALLSPLVFLLVLWAWSRAVQPKVYRQQPISLYLFLVSFPVFAGFALLSLHSRVYGNWPGAGYVPAAVLVSAMVCHQRPKIGGKTGFGNRVWPWAVGTSYLLTAVVLLQGAAAVFPVPLKWDRIARETGGWQTLGREAKRQLDAMPDPARTFLFGLRYQEASQLAFYTPGQPATVAINRWGRPNVYDYWWTDEQLMGRDAVGVTRSPESHRGRLLQVFERVDPPVAVRIDRRQPLIGSYSKEPPLKVFYLYRAYGFTGGLRWKPRSERDIRAGEIGLQPIGSGEPLRLSCAAPFSAGAPDPFSFPGGGANR